MRFFSTIWPSSHLATVQNSTSKLFPVGGISVPSGPFIGPVMVPRKRAMEHVQAPETKNTR